MRLTNAQLGVIVLALVALLVVTMATMGDVIFA